MNMQKVFEHNEAGIDFLDIPATTNANGTRHYETPSGTYPSVTTVVGWEKSQFFKEWRKKNPKESRRVLNRGNILHETIEDYLNNKSINLMSKPPVVASLFMQMKSKLDEIGNIHALEVPLWSKTLGLAGRVDCVAEYNGELSIIDFKGSTREKYEADIQNYFLQGTAYALMWQERTGTEIKKFNIIISNEDGMPCQVFTGNTIDYVKPLHDTIQKYHEHNKTLNMV